MPLGFHKAALFGVAGVSTGDVVLLSTQTASDDASIAFTSNIDSTYKEYIFRFYNINPATDAQDFGFQVNAVGGDSFDETITSTFFRADHNEADDQAYLQYYTHGDQAQGTAYQVLGIGVGNGADESCVGELHLFNPSSTTYVKQFYATMSVYMNGGWARENVIAGYINTTTAIDEIDFKFTPSGNINEGTIKMWGVK